MLSLLQHVIVIRVILRTVRAPEQPFEVMLSSVRFLSLAC